MTLILILTIAGYSQYTVIDAKDPLTCDRWGQLSIEAGDATAYRCIS